MTTYIVSKDGSGTHSTIQAAANVAAAGDTVQVKNGTYNEKLTIQNSGTSTNWITFTNYPGHAPVIDGTGLLIWDNTWKGLVEITGNVNYVKISGLQIINSNVFGMMITSWNGATSNIIIEKTYFTNNFNCGLVVEASTNILVDNNEFTQCQTAVFTDGSKQIGETLTFGGVSNYEIRYNKLYNNGAESICNKLGCNNGKVYHNDISQHMSAGVYIDAWNAHNYNIDVYNNKIHDSNVNGARGIAVASERIGTVDHINIYNNIIYNIPAIGIHIPWYSQGAVNYVNIANNTIYKADIINNWGGGICLDTITGVDANDGNGLVVGSTSNIIAKNNIVSQNNVAQINNGQGNNVTITNNLIDGSGGVTGLNPIISSPKFLSTTIPDFHLQSTSPAINAGSTTQFYPLTDYDNITRSSPPDIGAFEYVGTPPACPIPVTTLNIT